MRRIMPVMLLCACGGSAPSFAPKRSGEVIQSQGQQLQGQQLQGQQLQGTQLASEPLVIHSYDGWMLNGHPLKSLTLTQGQLVGTFGWGHTVDLTGAIAPATQSGAPISTVINAVWQDPTFPDGSTYLYDVRILNADGSTAPLCRPDANGVAAAIPIAAVFDSTGARIESTTQFTFGCTAGVVAKCYRWGYRPWINGDPQFAQLHWACTRMARADYCGDGRTWTQEGTSINLWDTAPAPGPFNTHGNPPLTYLFEAGWNTQGAVCLSKQRWLTLPPSFANACPDKLIAPGVSVAGATVCDTSDQALLFDATTQLFDESQLNLQ